MSIARFGYLRSPRDLVAEVHLADEVPSGTGTVTAVCGVTFAPAAIFNATVRDHAPPPPDGLHRVCVVCQAVVAA